MARLFFMNTPGVNIPGADVIRQLSDIVTRGMLRWVEAAMEKGYFIAIPGVAEVEADAIKMPFATAIAETVRMVEDVTRFLFTIPTREMSCPEAPAMLRPFIISTREMRRQGADAIP